MSINNVIINTINNSIQSAIGKNSSTTALSSEATFTGAWEQNSRPGVMVSCQTDNGGTLYFDFSVNGSDANTFPVSGFTLSSGIHEFHTAVKGARYFRVRLVNDSGAQSYLRLYTYYGQFRQGNAPLNQPIGSDSDAITVKAVQAGQQPDGTFSNTLQDGAAFRTTTNLGGTDLTGSLSDSAVGAQNIFTDVSGFPAGGGYIYIGTELIQYDSRDSSTQLTLTTGGRGSFGTTAAAHSSSDVVGEAYNSGILTLEGYTQVATKILSSNTGTGYFQWYSDIAGTDIIRTISPPYVNINTYDYLAAPSFGPYVRYVWINTQNSDTTDFFLETDFYTKSISAQVLTMNSTILPAMTSNLTRSVVVGKQPDGDFTNIPTDGAAFSNTTTLGASTILTQTSLVDNSTTNIPVAARDGIAVDDYLRIEDEYVKVTGGTGSGAGTLTATRAQLGSTAVQHDIDLTISTVGENYTDNTYANVSTTGGTGSGLTLNITVSDGIITVVSVNTYGSGGYVSGDIVTPNGTTLGNATGAGAITLGVLPAVSRSYIANSVVDGQTVTWFDSDGYNTIELLILADQQSVTNGIELQFTDDTGATTPSVRIRDFYTFSSINVTSGRFLLDINTASDGYRIIYTNGTVAQGSFYTESTLKTNGKDAKTKLSEDLQADTNVTNTRSVISGEIPNGTYSNVSLDTRSNVNVNVNSSLTSFDEITVSNTKPVEQLKFVYGIPPNVEPREPPFLSPGTSIQVSTVGDASTAQSQSIYMPKSNSFTKGTLSLNTANYFQIQSAVPTSYYVWFNDEKTLEPSATGTGIQVDIFTSTLTAGGSGYTDDTYTNVATTTSGSGTGLTLDITTSAGIITDYAINEYGSGYVATDTLTPDSTTLGGGSSGLVTIDSYSSTPSSVATLVTAAINGSGAAITAVATSSIVTCTNDANGAVTSASVFDYSSINGGPFMPTVSNSTITTTTGNPLLNITSGNGLGDYAVMRGSRQIKYLPGQGVVVRFSAIFDSSSSDTLQFAGVGNSTNGLYVGYNCSQFGIRHQYGGIHAIRTLEITETTTGSGDVTVTVDGVDFIIPLSASSLTPIQSANEIAATDFSSSLYSVDSVVENGGTGSAYIIFLSYRTTAGTGTESKFNYVDTGSTGATGSFVSTTTDETPNTTVVDSTKDDIAQVQFNIDKLDGTGPSGFTLDPQKGNVYQIQYQWLGFGRITFFIENSVDGRLFPFHQIRPMNSLTTTTLNQPDMQLSAFTVSSSADNTKTLQIGSMGAFIEGEMLLGEPFYSTSNSHTGISSASDNIMLAIRNPRTFKGITSQVVLKLRSLSISSSKSAANTRGITTFKLVIGGTPASTPEYQYFTSPLASPTYVSIPEAAANSLSSFTPILQASVGAEGGSVLDLTKENIQIQKNQNLYIIYDSSITSGTVDVSASVAWFELL